MKKILLIGQFCDISGYGNAVRSYFRTLASLDARNLIELKIINFSFEKNSNLPAKELEHIHKFDLCDTMKLLYNETRNLSDEQINKIKEYKSNEYDVIFFLTNNWIEDGSQQDIPKNALNLYSLCRTAKNVYPCVVWETDRVPYSLRESYNRLDNIKTLLCACTWNSDVFSRDTGLDTVVIPYNLDHKDVHDADMLDTLNQKKSGSFAFCTVSQWGWRKGYDILLKSFLTEFYDEDVVLFLRAYKNRVFSDADETHFFAEQIGHIKSSIRRNSKPVEFKCKIVLVNSLLSEEQINSIYKASDVYITCTRGEGFGLPIAEFSLITSKPVIAPNKGGHLDLVNMEEFLIDSRYEPCYYQQDSNSLYSTEMNIIESSINSTRKKMREAYEMYQNNKYYFDTCGKNIKQNIEKYLDFERNVCLFETTLGL